MTMQKFRKIINKTTPFGYFLIASGLLIYLLKKDLDNLFYFSERTTFLFSILLMSYGMGIVLLRYLSGEKNLSDEIKKTEGDPTKLTEITNLIRHESLEAEKIKKTVADLHLQLELIKKQGLNITLVQREEIINELRQGILSEASNSILKEIENKYSENLQIESQSKSVNIQLSISKDRITEEIYALSRRGNVNLVIGVLTTCAAVAILGNTVLDLGTKLTSETMLSYLAPRITLSLFIEIFSFFFLKLYKSGLDEIKYFQNELTNIEIKLISLDVSLRSKNDNLIFSVVSDLAKTERNFVLKKGQSTVSVERSRIDSESTINMASSISKLIESIKKD